MTRAFAVRAAALYVPVCAVLLLWLLRPVRRRLGASVLLGLLWSMLGLAALQAVNVKAGWWVFAGHGVLFLGMPLELYFGWVILWGALPVMLFSGGPQASIGHNRGALDGEEYVSEGHGFSRAEPASQSLSSVSRYFAAGEEARNRKDLKTHVYGTAEPVPFRRLDLAWPVLVFAVFDLVMMPLCAPVVALSRRWLVGEAAGLALVFVPGLLLARTTLENRWLPLRSLLQMVLSGGLFLWLMPQMVFAVRGSSWSHALPRGRALMLVAQAIGLLALPGVAAVQEFCQRGRGTPIPQDPPQRLVVSGVYRYVANPMQMSCAMVMLVWGVALGSAWIAAVSAISVVYSAGIARWDEREDLRARYGVPWVRFRAEVKDWRWRWRPYLVSPEEATLYVAETCGVCSEVAAWFVARRPAGMRIVAAERYRLSENPGPKIRTWGTRIVLPHEAGSLALERMRYVAADGTYADGVAAFARGLEHLNAAWMLLGALMRLPVLAQMLQIIADGCGFGPQRLCATTSPADDAGRSADERLPVSRPSRTGVSSGAARSG